MKICAVFLLCCFLLAGCSEVPDEMVTGMELRSKLLQAQSSNFTADITADYGEIIHHFTMDCTADHSGCLAFTVTKPDTISGITGKINAEGGQIFFDNTALHFELLAEEQLSPISAPWILMQTLRSGYMTSACREAEDIRLSIDNSYADDPLHLDIWLDSQNLPERADILYAGRRILSITVTNFEIL